MGWAFFGVLNAGLAILCIIGIGYLLSHLKLLEGNRFMPQINPLMIMICFPSLNIYKIGITLPLRDAESWKALSAFLLWVAIIQLCIVAYMWATKGNAAEAGLLNLLLTANNTVIMGLPIVEATFVGPGTTVALLTIVGLFVLITPFSIVAFEFDRWMSTQVHERVGSMEAEKGIQHALDQLQGQQHESASSGSQPDAMTGQAAAPEPSFQQSSRPPQETNGLLAAPHKRVSEEGGVMETAAGAASRRRLTAGFYGPSAGGGGSRSTRPGQANGPPHSCFRDMSRSLLLPEGGQAAELGVRVAPIATPHGGDQGRGGGGKGGSDGRWEEPLGFATPSSPFSKALSLDTQELSLKEASSGRYQQIALAHDGHAWSVSVAELTRPQWFRAYLEVHKDSQDRRLLQLRKRRNLPHLAAVDAPLFMDFDRLLASPFQRRPQLNPEVELQTRLSIIEDHGGHLPFYKRFVTEHAQLLGVTMIVLKNPMLLSVVVALLMSLSDLRAFLDPTSDQYVPGLGWIALTLQLLSSITVPLALFSNGVWMYGKNLRADPRKVAAIVCLKWLVLPMLAICCAKVCGLSTASGMSLALLVSTPTASTAFVLAAQYNQGTELVTLVTIIGTVFLVPLTLLWLNVPKLMHLYDYDLSNLAGTV